MLRTEKVVSASVLAALASTPPSIAEFTATDRLTGAPDPVAALGSRSEERISGPLKHSESDRFMQSGKTLHDVADFVDHLAGTNYMDNFNTFRRRSPLSEELELMCIQEGAQHTDDLQQPGRNFANGIIDYISSDRRYYRLIINACKESTGMIIDLGFIPSYNRDELLNGLQKIEDEIANGRFEWVGNKDVRSNIVQALVDRVGEPARKLDATLCQHVQKLTTLRLWFYESADKIITQIKQLQVELVLLALRNLGFVLPHILGRANWILLGDLILSKVEQLEKDASQLRSCRDNIDSMLLIRAQLDSTCGSVNSRLSEDGSHRLIQNAVIDIASMITGDIAINLSCLEEEMRTWMSFQFLTPNEKVTESVSVLTKHIMDLDKLTAIQSDSLTSNIQDVSQRFLDVYVIIEQMLKVAADLGKHASFDHAKVQSSLPTGSVKTPVVSDNSMVKAKEKDQSDEKKKNEDERATAMQILNYAVMSQ